MDTPARAVAFVAALAACSSPAPRQSPWNGCAPGLLRCAAGCCGATELTAGSTHSCALAEDGTPFCWGEDVYGALGDGPGSTCPNLNCAHPKPVPGLAGPAQLSAGPDHTCALVDGAVRCWGINSLGELGLGTQTEPIPSPSDPVPLGTLATAIWGGLCASLAGGGVSCWGGTGPPADPGFPRPVVALSGACALLDDATVACEEFDFYGSSLGIHVVAELAGVTSFCSGYGHRCAVTGGAVSCWGNNQNLQCGAPATIDSVAAPTGVEGLAGPAQAVVCGDAFSCALLSNGSVQCWGSNAWGEIGVPCPQTQSYCPGSRSPVTIPISNVVQLATNPYASHTCALDSDGRIACWGRDLEGQLGGGQPDPVASATPVPILTP